MKRKSVGLVTWLGGPNFGTVLQSYALYKSIENLGYRVTILTHWTFIFGLKLKLGMRRLFQQTATTAKAAAMQKEELRTRTFITEAGYFLARCSKDALVCGSDQMWNTSYNFNPDFFLAGRGPLKISYAPSVGTADFKEDSKPSVKSFLSDFKYISVREQTGRHAVERLTGRDDIKVVMDPVFLPGRAKWEEFAAKATGTAAVQGGKYLLCYLLRKRDDYPTVIGNTAAGYGLKRILIVRSFENPGLSVEGAETVCDAGPREFVRLIADAAAVLTDSFHGTAFSIIFNKEVTALKRFDDADEASQNSRISDLFSSLGIVGGQPFDWDSINTRLAEMADDSRNWLKKAIDDVR